VHELSIALSLIDGASEERARLAGARVVAVHVRIGALSGVVPEALEFAFEVAVQDSDIAGARLMIEQVPAAIYCDTCAAERELPSVQHFRCPVCDGPAARLVRGRELELTALEIDDHVPANR
jgi:hydrogenase nickel incorporation protein HypA/HybF